MSSLSQEMPFLAFEDSSCNRWDWNNSEIIFSVLQHKPHYQQLFSPTQGHCSVLFCCHGECNVQPVVGWRGGTEMGVGV